MTEFTTRDELVAGLAHVLASPSDEGVLEGIVTRPEKGKRGEVETCALSAKGGVDGDRWVTNCWKTTDDGSPHPDVQVSLINARSLDLIARDRNRWALAGDNLVIDFDLTPRNAPTGQRLAIGTAIIQITDVPHMACATFIERYGRDAGVFVNTGDGRKHLLRGRLGRIVQDGQVTIGDTVTKLA